MGLELSDLHNMAVHAFLLFDFQLPTFKYALTLWAASAHFWE